MIVLLTASLAKDSLHRATSLATFQRVDKVWRLFSILFSYLRDLAHERISYALDFTHQVITKSIESHSKVLPSYRENWTSKPSQASTGSSNSPRMSQHPSLSDPNLPHVLGRFSSSSGLTSHSFQTPVSLSHNRTSTNSVLLSFNRHCLELTLL
ncbi:hypothetical protein Tco_0065712 [Tanacetum coccineum]